MKPKTHKDKWMTAMVAKHGSEDAVKEFMREAQKKSRINYKGTGGFYVRRDIASEMGKRRGKNYESKISETKG